MQNTVVKIEDMIVEGSMTAQDAMHMGYRWNAVVTGGDALAIRNEWLKNSVPNDVLTTGHPGVNISLAQMDAAEAFVRYSFLSRQGRKVNSGVMETPTKEPYYVRFNKPKHR